MKEKENLFQDFEIIINDAYSDFFENETHPNGSAYVIHDACEKMIIKYSLDPVKRLPELIRFSSVLPKDILEIIAPLDSNTTWTDFALSMSYVILGKEMMRIYPDVKKEEERRIREYDE